MRRVVLSIAVAFALLVLFSPTSLRATSNTEILFSKGMVVYSQGEFKKASRFFSEVCRQDPNHLDGLYFLGLTYLRLEKFSMASGAFEKLLGKDPGYSKAYFDYGWSLYQEGRFTAALGAFEKSLQSSDPKTAQSAREWIAKIKAGEKPEPRKKGKRWKLRGSTSLLYDSNVNLDPDLENLPQFNLNQADMMTNVSLYLQYLVHEGQRGRFAVEYSGSQSAYSNIVADFDSFNYGRHEGGMQWHTKFGDRFRWRFPVHYLFTTLGAAKYFESYMGSWALDAAWNPRWLTTLQANMRRDNFFNTPSQAVQNRDSLRPSFALEQYFFFPSKENRYLKGGYEFEKNFARGDDWDYNAHHIAFAAASPLFWKLQALFLSHYIFAREFDHRDSVFSAFRKDAVLQLTGILSREILPFLDVGATYSFAYSDSNLDRFTFKRHVWGLIFSAKI